MNFEALLSVGKTKVKKKIPKVRLYREILPLSGERPARCCHDALGVNDVLVTEPRTKV